MHRDIDVVVLMSVYRNDKSEWLTQSIESIMSQSYKKLHLLLSIDGTINEELMGVIEKYHKTNTNMTIFSYSTSQGLALRLNQMIDYALSNFSSLQYLARMDADDISHITRIEKQINYLKHNHEVDIVGCNVNELDTTNHNIRLKKMPTQHNDLVANIIKRCPFNHPTVVMRRRIFEEKGIRYDSSLKNTQNYKLWVDLIFNKFKLANIDEALLTFRVSENFYKKRGLSKAKNDVKSRLYAIKKLKIHSIKNYFYVLLILILRLSPKPVAKFAYNKLR
ncbi:glycosyltransferase [Providencia sp. PROV144]|uniref:glycosyltransferase n=1 Tax=Providencia sp. PROV144 TaxID=2949854 RepID=UPI00234ACBFF|nr:glycosyltransferase [Providencia sp. PROV144]